jgi:putative transposase
VNEYGHRVILASLEVRNRRRKDTTMAEDRMALLEMLRKATADGDTDFLREGVRVLAQAVMEAEVSELTGLPKGERDPDRRLTSRNGYRDRRWDTRVGTIGLAIPKVRDGSYFPSLLEPRRRAERALLAVVQEAYVLGVSTRRVDDLVRALGLEGISRSEVSRICAGLDAEVAAFRGRSLAGEAYPYVWLDATYLKVREQGRVVSMAALVATGVAGSGERRILGLELSAGNDEGSAWPAFIRSLVERGLHGVRLVISDDHAGLVKAVREQILGSGWQRCRVHFTAPAVAPQSQCTQGQERTGDARRHECAGSGDLEPHHSRLRAFRRPDQRGYRRTARLLRGGRPV